MFSFGHSSELLLHQIPSTLCQQGEDFHNGHHHPTITTAINPHQTKPAPKRSYNTMLHQLQHDPDEDVEKKKKRMEHREIERKRRQDMAALCSSLRSLLPLDFIKGRRSMSEHMNQAVNYIRHLEENIKRLNAKRDELKKTCRHVNDSSDHVVNGVKKKNSESEGGSNGHPITVTVRCSHGGIEVLIKSTYTKQQGFLISRVVKTLFQEGLNVISCNSIKVNERLIHTIQSEAIDDETCIEVSTLQQKLADLVITAS